MIIFAKSMMRGCKNNSFARTYDLCCKECGRKADFEDKFEWEYRSAFFFFSFLILIIDGGQRIWSRDIEDRNFIGYLWSL